MNVNININIYIYIQKRFLDENKNYILVYILNKL